MCEVEKLLVQNLLSLRRYALKLTKNASNADDLVQSTCVKILASKEKFELGTNFKGWSARVMFNLFATEHNRHAKFGSTVDGEELALEVREPRSHEESFEVKEILALIGKMNPIHREVLLMAGAEKEYPEMAEALNVPIGTIRSRLSRAREDIAHYR